MTREQIKSYMELFKAYSEGKEIEVIVPVEKGWKWVPAKELHLNDLGSYRVKPELKLRPYANTEELLKAQKDHGPNIAYDKFGYNSITQIEENSIWINPSQYHQKISFDKLVNYTWQDGHPCGILIE